MTVANDLLLRHLNSPGAGDAVLDELARDPSRAAEAILEFKGPYPEGANPIDVHEGPLRDLLTGLLRRCPQLLIGPDPIPMPPQPFLLISAAITAGDPRFAGAILPGLEDRSIYVKLLVVDGVAGHSFLRTPAVKVRLQELMAMKSIARDRYVLERFQRALESFGPDRSRTEG